MMKRFLSFGTSLVLLIIVLGCTGRGSFSSNEQSRSTETPSSQSDGSAIDGENGPGSGNTSDECKDSSPKETIVLPTCKENTFNGVMCQTNKSSYVTTQILGDHLGVDGSPSVFCSIGFCDGTQRFSIRDKDLVPGNVLKDVDILGIKGTLSPVVTGSFKEFVPSSQLRSIGSPQVSLLNESYTNQGVDYSNSSTGYRAIPNIFLDDDGTYSNRILPVNRNGWSSKSCGIGFNKIEDKISDCFAKMGAEAHWQGEQRGNSIQGSWKLVSRTMNAAGSTRPMGREVWQDQRTGLLWSSLVSRGLNWCKATGHNNIQGNFFKQEDPANVCNLPQNQNTGDLGHLKAISACYEDGEVHLTSVDSAIDNEGKALLGYKSSRKVAWRLPTLEDYIVADLNGLRFVFPDTLGYGGQEWTATLVSTSNSTGRSRAWVYLSSDGSRNVADRNAIANVRCIGR